MKELGLLIGSLICLLSLQSKAQSYVPKLIDTLSNNVYKLDEVTVSAPINLLTNQQWPGSVSVLDSIDLTSGNSHTVADQINKLPGVIMQQGTLSTNRLTIRGLGSRTPYNSNRIKAYWGDIPLTDGDGVTSIEDIGFNEIGNIKILKGPSSALYGAGLGGVILINPWRYILDDKLIHFKSEAGNYATFSNQLSLVLKNKRSQTFISSNHLTTDGYRDNSRYQRHNISLRGKVFRNKNTFHYTYNYRRLYGQIPSSLDSVDFYYNPEKAAASWAAIGGYETSNRHIISIGLATQINSKLYHSISLFNTISDLDELRPFNRLNESRKMIGLRDKLVYSHKLFRLEVGFEGMHERTNTTLYGVKEVNNGLLLNEANIRRQYINIFGLAEYNIFNKWLIQGAFNLNKTRHQHKNVKLQTQTTHDYPLVFSPRLGVNYKLTSSSNIYAAVGHGFSTPSVEEAQMSDGSFNRTIKPEEGIHIDFGYRLTSKSQKTRAELTLYWMQMSNLLVTKRESDAVFYGINAGKTKHKGIEAWFSHQIVFNRFVKVIINTSYAQSINEFVNFIDEGNDFKGNKLPGIPTFTTHFGTTFIANKTKMHLNYQHWGSQYLNDDNSKSHEGFGVLNGKISQTIKFRNFESQIYIGANNVLNKHYASMVLINAPSFGNKQPRYYYPGLPLNLFAGLSIVI